MGAVNSVPYIAVKYQKHLTAFFMSKRRSDNEFPTQNPYVDVTSIYIQFRDSLDAMGTGELIALMLEAAVVSLAVKAIAILVSVVLINRMILLNSQCRENLSTVTLRCSCREGLFYI